MFYFDPMYFVFVGPALLLAIYAQFRVKSTFGKYTQVLNMRGLTGAHVARLLLDMAGLRQVRIERVPGDLSDHYDPSARMVRLSDSTFDSPSLGAMGVVAHEVGHAIQDATGYAPMRWRAGLVPVASIGSNLGYILFFIGFAINLVGLAWLGILLFSSAAVFALVTLPVEYNASNRALALLNSAGLISPVEYDGARQVLNAAALTYVAGFAQAVSQLLYLVFILSGMRSRED